MPMRAGLLAIAAMTLAATASIASSALPAAAQAGISSTDDAGNKLTLSAPARRIVSLAPHTTEILFAVGAGERVVGVVQYSDYPPAAERIVSVGSGVALDLERILRLQPDLVVAWSSGNSAIQLERLRELGIPVYETEPRDYEAIAVNLERLSVLTGTRQAGHRAASDFRARLARLKSRYRDRPVLDVFYQIWRSPLMTLNGEHLVSQALQLCGARNIFAALRQIAPTVSVEAVVKADPDVIIASAGEQGDLLAQWRQFPGMKAVAHDNLRVIDGGLMNRAGPRVLDGTEALCHELDAARERLNQRR